MSFLVNQTGAENVYIFMDFMDGIYRFNVGASLFGRRKSLSEA